jgi:hypothetical protein
MLGRSAAPDFHPSKVLGVPLHRRGRAPRARHNF